MSKTKESYPCVVCYKEVISDAIECSLCQNWLHRKCAKLSKKELVKLSNEMYNWYCYKCDTIFPYRNISDDEFNFLNSTSIIKPTNFELYTKCQELESQCLESNEFSGCDFDMNIDPDDNYFKEFKQTSDYLTDENFVSKTQNVKGLSLIHFNYRSIKSSFEELKEYLINLRREFDVICISESWLNDNDNINEFMLDNYDMVYKNRKNKRGGGVLIYVVQSLKFKEITEMTENIDNVYECISIEINMDRGKNIVITCLYRTTGTSIEVFLEYLENMLNLLKKNKMYFLVGDFNINLINNVTHNASSHFADLLFSQGLYPLINKPTRIAFDTATLIDNIFTNNYSVSTNGVLISDISDHLPIFTLLHDDSYIKHTNTETKYKRHVTDQNLTTLNIELTNYDWNSVFQSGNANDAYEIFINTVQKSFDKNCPIKLIKTKTKIRNKPWLTKSLLNACKKQKLLYKRFLKNRTAYNESKYKAYKNKLTSIKRHCEKIYYTELIEKNKRDIKATWKTLNEVMNKKRTTSSYPKEFKDENDSTLTNFNDIVNKFNNFFVNVGPNLAKKIQVDDKADIFDYMSPSNDSSMYLTPVSSDEIITTTVQCKSKTSEDYNSLSMNVIKYIIKTVVKPFEHICNLSFKTGVVPDGMKIAKIIPLYKSGDKQLFTNYRPVALLPQFSKIIEKLFCKRLNAFIDKYNLLTDSQYGFRPKRSTSTALLELVEEIVKANDNRKYTIGVFIDLRKAFDTIDHVLLLRKLEKMGIRGTANHWLYSYLQNRKQYVSLGKYSSHLSTVLCGVPQGSVLGPLLFILYINDICNVSNLLKLILFADDTNLFRSGDNLEKLSREISVELSKLNVWFKVNKLSLNVAKTNFIVFSGKKRVDGVRVTIDSKSLEQVDSTKFLGVIIDERLTWKQHICNMKTKLSKCIAILYKCNRLLETSSLRVLYCSLFLPYLNYCCEVWGTTFKSTTQCISILQKKAIRLICKENYRAHTSGLFYSLRLLKLEDLIKLKCAVVMFKVHNNQLPLNLQNKFSLVKDTEKYSLRCQNKFKMNYVRTTRMSHCISTYGVKLYNSLPESITSKKNILSFKSNYVKFLLQYYS